MMIHNDCLDTLSIDIFDDAHSEHFVPDPLQRRLPIALSTAVPSKSEVHLFVDDLFEYLFPLNPRQLRKATVWYDVLVEQLQQLLTSLLADPKHIVDTFLATLPPLYDTLLLDAEATLAFDPAANSLAEVIATYPGFYTTAVYRLAHVLHQLDVPLLPRMMTEYAHSQTGIDIHPTAQIGHSFVIDHGTGTVIGATAHIGNHVVIYHGVTLGALQVNKSLANSKRHPTIEDHVIIYANATVLGGDTIVGHHSILGGNIWLTGSVPPHSRIYYEDKATVNKQKQNPVPSLVTATNIYS